MVDLDANSCARPGKFSSRSHSKKLDHVPLHLLHTCIFIRMAPTRRENKCVAMQGKWNINLAAESGFTLRWWPTEYLTPASNKAIVQGAEVIIVPRSVAQPTTNCTRHLWVALSEVYTFSRFNLAGGCVRSLHINRQAYSCKRQPEPKSSILIAFATFTNHLCICFCMCHCPPYPCRFLRYTASQNSAGMWISQTGRWCESILPRCSAGDVTSNFLVT